MNQSNPYRVPFIALTSLFFIWGFITVIVDAFIPRLKDVFELSYGEAGLVQVAWFLAYFLISIPGGILVSKLGYKRGIIGGLAVAGIGCFLFFPAASFRSFPFFLMALFTLAGGITILQVAANPFVSVLGDEDKASSRLNLAQAFNSLGTALAPVIAAAFLLSDKIKSSTEIEALNPTDKDLYYAGEAQAVQGPFLAIAGFLILLAVIFFFVKLPNILKEEDSGTYGQALSFTNLRLGIIGIFVYVGAEVAIGSYLVNYFMTMGMDAAIIAEPFTKGIAQFIANVFKGQDLAQIDGKAIVGTFVLFYWSGAMVGRFIGSYLMQRINPGRILSMFAFGAIALLVLTMMTDGFVAMWTVLFIGLFNSIMFPTIFTQAIDGLGDLKPKASGLLCTAIVGGAVIPPLFGLAIDSFGFTVAFILPLLCYLYIAYFGYWSKSQVEHKQF